ncbi:hypothetical protein GpartN1_g2145.t1 [Galdieria partita]|uniref:Uncharacterized protein n=1 Tax=Galdieria partita TaxID=83374 RepID=A0A9C7PUB6_9RHOD|nr:hypothetical protein GpartN1_g2145.t1 [Galdieria partita]
MERHNQKNRISAALFFSSKSGLLCFVESFALPGMRESENRVDQSPILQLLHFPPTCSFDTISAEIPRDQPIHKPLALQLLLGSLPQYSDSREESSSIESRHPRKAVRYEQYEDLKKVKKSWRERLEKRKKQLEECGLPLSVLFCYHIPVDFTEADLCKLLFEQLGILGVATYHMEWSNNRNSRVCWIYFISDEWCELAAFRLVQVVEEGVEESLPFEFSFSLPKNDDIVQWKTSKKRKRISKLESSLTTAHQLGLVSNTLFFDYIEADISLDHFKKILSENTSGLTHVRITEPLLRRRPGRHKQQTCLIETSRLGWATYASETFLLSALARLKTLCLDTLGVSIPKIDETASKQKLRPESFISQRQRNSQISALESSGKKITFIYEN